MTSFTVEKSRVICCLDELESEYLRIGSERCDCLRTTTQLSAFLRLGIRAVSLLRSMCDLLDPARLDAYDPVRRAWYEAWSLQFEFRFKDSATKVQKWFQGQPDTWNATTSKLEVFIKTKANAPGGLGREYGNLSELAHPTCDATINSSAVVTTRRGLNASPETVTKSLQDLTGDFSELLNRETWLAIDDDPQWIEIQVVRTNLPCSLIVYESYLKYLQTQGL